MLADQLDYQVTLIIVLFGAIKVFDHLVNRVLKSFNSALNLYLLKIQFSRLFTYCKYNRASAPNQ